MSSTRLGNRERLTAPSAQSMAVPRIGTIGRTNRAGSVDELVDRYEEHVAGVSETLPAERLLIWSPNEGWEPLHLGCTYPDRLILDRVRCGRTVIRWR